MTPTIMDTLRMRVAGWAARLLDYMATADARHHPRAGDVWRSGDWTTTVRVTRAATVNGRPGYGVVIHRGTEVQGGEMEHATFVEMVRGYRLASRGAE